MHLFDIDIKGGQYFKESDVLTPGDDFTVVDTDLGRIGIGICYDVRFPEYFRALSTMGAEMVLLPAAFNMTTGPLHWEISLRVRALRSDIDIKGGQYFKESDVLTPGDDFTVVDTDLGRIGIGICYDVRFPEYFRALSTMGAEMVLLPAAFNMTTGPLHWEISLRVRALDNQIFMVGASSARNESGTYVSYANSRIIDPWGTILAGADEKIGRAHV